MKVGVVTRVAGVVLGSGLFASLASSACILHDSKFYFESPGHWWCGQADGAQVWDTPGNEVDLLIPNLDDPPQDDYPIGCDCLYVSEHEDMLAWQMTPPDPMDAGYDEYTAIVDRIRTATYDRCEEGRDLPEYDQYANDNCFETSYDEEAPLWELSHPLI